MLTAARRLLARRGPTAPATARLARDRPPPPPAGVRSASSATMPLLPRRVQRRAYTKTTIALTEVNPLTKAK